MSLLSPGGILAHLKMTLVLFKEVRFLGDLEHHSGKSKHDKFH